MKKILIFDLSSGVTGALKAARNIQEALFKNNDVEILVPKYNKLSRYKNKLFYLPLRKKIFNICFFLPCLIFTSIQLYFYLNKKNIELLIINDSDNLTGFLVKLFGWNGDVITFVRRIPTGHPKFLSDIYSFAAQKYSIKIISVSNAVLSKLPDSDKNLVIYDTMFNESKDFKPINDIKLIKFLYIGNYMEGKGQLEALKSFHSCFLHKKNIKITFIGDDLDVYKNKIYKKNLIDYVNHNNLSDSVDILEFKNDITKYINDSTVVLNFAYNESFSMTCVEAASCGRPVIATRSGGPEEIIENNKSGLLVENKNIDEMIKAMNWMINNPNKISYMGSYAKERYNNIFSNDIFNKKIESLIE